ncbi:hypothetical protein TWF102_004604 [Orbilia oligospora]|uniref:Uncharacterized protein n=1 Tax=Orbilia oligospora TaxID=2813651 RepID=A0A7C8NG73_ORBOL|nr:hypothetical protein TWF103_008042 [Orbilia oligospora]KAF3102404.1 hypothetical protein TWF102_004604 [Orbilia oligospora]KAF3122389.1 hypothetical protein TWF703_001416 [Orbilia oligospora]
MAHPQPLYMPVRTQSRPSALVQPSPYLLPPDSPLGTAFATVEHILLRAGGIEVLIEMAPIALESLGRQWTPATAQEHAFAFFTDALFPFFVIDHAITDTYSFGYHLRYGGFDRVIGRLIVINAQLVEAAETEPDNMIPLFKLIHTISHEIAHTFLSYCFAVSADPNDPNPPIEYTPPRLNYLDRYGDAAQIGEAGFWFDARVWGGAVFYNQMTTHSVGIPTSCWAARRRDSELNQECSGRTEILVSTTGAIKRGIPGYRFQTRNYVKYYIWHITLPIITYMPSDGDQYREYDGQMPSILQPQSGQQRGGYLRPFVVIEYRRRVKVLH